MIVGGGFGGLIAARRLRRADVELTLVDRQNFFLFQPLVYQVATGALSPAEIAVPLRAVVKRQSNVRVLLAEVTGFDLGRRQIILDRLQGHYDFGDGRKKEDPNYMIFSARNCNYPQPKYAVWWLTQFRRWGMVEGPPDYAGVAKQVMRADLYEDAMREIGYRHGGPDGKPEKLFDGAVFDPAKPEEFARSFAVHGLKG